MNIICNEVCHFPIPACVCLTQAAKELKEGQQDIDALIRGCVYNIQYLVFKFGLIKF